ncbi:MAG TPA: hypothetical protein VGK16_14670 [Candidatus Limnocylindrales bacterium]|jgi:hypothetical protein
MQDVWTLLTAWRRAEERLDDLATDSPERGRAVADVQAAHAAYVAGMAQAVHRLHEAEVAAQPVWFAPRAGAPFVSTG